VLVDIDSRTVAMEVGTRSEVCNNLPAESTSPENGWRLNVIPILDPWIVIAKRRASVARPVAGSFADNPR